MTPRRLLLALLLPACAASQRPSSARPPRRFVLVTEAAALRTAPDASGAALALTHPGPFAFRRVRTRGDVVELETVAAPERQCAAAIVPPAGMRLRFYTTTRALGQAVARPLHLSGPEGSLTVAVGAPVREAADGVSLEVAHAGLRVSLREAPAVARSFAEPHAETPVERAERLGPGTRALLPEGAAVTVGDDAPVLVFLRSPMLQGSRVVVATPCVRFEGTVPSSAVLPVLDMELGDASRARLPRRVIRAGARLQWPGAGPAGRTVAAVAMADEGTAEGALRCFRVPLRVHGATVEPPPEVTVCAAAADVQDAGGEL
jgi:hypothetical protein